MDKVRELVDLTVQTLDDKKGLNIKIINITGLSPIGDYFVVATGTNPNQLHAMSDDVQEKLAHKGIYAKSVEGYQSANWILMDYGDFMIHLFTPEAREYYNLERVWKDAIIE